MPAPPYDDAWLADYQARAAGWRGTGGGRGDMGIPITDRSNLPEIPDSSTDHFPAAGNMVESARYVCDTHTITTGDGITIILTGTPVAKGRPRIARGRAYTPEKTARWEAAAKASARAQWGPEPPLDGALRVELTAVLPVPASWSKRRKAEALDLRILPQGRPDLDNYIKATFDALNEVAWRDDAQVTACAARKIYGGRPRVEVKVECL